MAVPHFMPSVARGRKPSFDEGPLGAATPVRSEDAAPNLALPWVVRLRYGIVLGELALVLGMRAVFRLGVPLFWVMAPLAVILCSNVLVNRKPQVSPRFPQQTLAGLFVLDILCLTAVLGLTGGAMNPFSVLYLVQITLSAVVLQKAWTWVLGSISTICFGLLFFFNVPLPGLHVHEAEPGLSPHLVGMWIAFILATALIVFFTGKISDALRQRDQQVLALQEEIAKKDRLASLVTLAAGAAHELGTPLGTIAVVARELERFAAALPEGDAALADARLIRAEVDRCRLILERMSVEGAEPMGEAARSILVTDLFDEVLRQFPAEQRRHLAVEVRDVQTVAVLPVQATIQSLVALVKNALDANVSSVPVRLCAVPGGPEITFSVSDQGQGMPETVLRRIGEPFFTTKEPGRGMGLGTFLVRTFAERMGGRLSFSSSPGKGTTALLELPSCSLRREVRDAV